MSILRLKVVLNKVRSPITRTREVPSDPRLDRLHFVLQAAMGWEKAHLYSFSVSRHPCCVHDPDLGLNALPDNEATLQETLAAAGVAPLVYTYDLGDNWRHVLTATPVGGPAAGQFYRGLIEVECRCPPEDVGGPLGYQHVCTAISDLKHRDYLEVVERHHGPFHLSVPDTATHQVEVLKLAKRWQSRKPCG